MARMSYTRERLLEATLSLIWDECLRAASVDAICEKAGVSKGNFYHIFESKEHLVVSALEAHFGASRIDYDRIFSPSVPPVDRLRRYFEHLIRKQEMKREKVGRVVGSPYVSAGVSSSTSNQLIRGCVRKLLDNRKKYLETTLRDGNADGSIPQQDIPRTVEAVLDYIEGALTLGRIQNSMTPIQNIAHGAFKLIGLDGAPPVLTTNA